MYAYRVISATGPVNIIILQLGMRRYPETKALHYKAIAILTVIHEANINAKNVIRRLGALERVSLITRSSLLPLANIKASKTRKTEKAQ